MKKSKIIEETQNILNGNPCQHENCGVKNKQCNHCGRVNCRGNVLIQHRSGVVHFERLNGVHIKMHNKLSEAEQETNTIKLWIGSDI